MATRTPTGWARLPGVAQAQARLHQARQRIDSVKIANRPLSWFITGWRGGLIVLIVAILFPQYNEESQITTLISVGVYVILALGLNIVVGYAGLLDLGYVAFFILGSYAYAIGTQGFIVNSAHQIVPIPVLPFWILLPGGALLAGVFGVLLGAPTLRLRGDYLAIVTLGFGEIARIFFLNVPYFGSVNGVQPSPLGVVSVPILGTLDFGSYLDHTPLYYLVLTIVVMVILLVQSLRNSSMGRALIAIREDETAAAATGVNLVRTKLLAFALGATIGGIGGVLNAAAVPSIDPATFVFAISITILVMIVLGGIGSIPGVILGAFLLQYFNTQVLGNINQWVHTNGLVASTTSPFHFLFTFDFNQAKFLMYGLVLLAMVLFRPQGIIPDVRRKRELKGEAAIESAETFSAVGLLAKEQAGEAVSGIGAEDHTEYAGPGSDAQGRED